MFQMRIVEENSNYPSQVFYNDPGGKSYQPEIIDDRLHTGAAANDLQYDDIAGDLDYGIVDDLGDPLLVDDLDDVVADQNGTAPVNGTLSDGDWYKVHYLFK